MTWRVDEIIEVPQKDIDRQYRPNARAKKVGLAKKGYDLYLPKPYNGKTNLLVRTALIRSDEYSTKDLPNCATPDLAAKLCEHLKFYDQEHIVGLSLNKQLNVTAIHEAAIGGRSEAGVFSLDMVKVPILTSATAMIVVHNHPGGSPEPSSHDRFMFENLKKSAECFGIQVLDSVVVARKGWYSIGQDEGGYW